MNNTLKLSAIIAFASFATTAAAECTEASVQEKTMEISTGMQALAATNPEKMMEISNELQAAMTEAAAAEDIEAVCTSLDAILADMNG
ncbi:hypothetical protein CLV80_102165 [Yoonia maritima]|uniref:HdeA/HdeB family protein n=1 Tax=Yoonia maritima TaxID=1435347 RepID=A0A2T0W2V7_9RHOB|nr:hypothetical protein [Yoonia maritima]PRY79520.1 hypothetical protein CLV80_102165 [Yoonia maritima]